MVSQIPTIPEKETVLAKQFTGCWILKHCSNFQPTCKTAGHAPSQSVMRPFSSCRIAADDMRCQLPGLRPQASRGGVVLPSCSSRSPSSVKGSSSAGSTGSQTGSGGSTLQEDLLKLIGPDYLDSDCEVSVLLTLQVAR